MIQSFADKQTEKLFRGHRSKLPPEIQERAAMKLAALSAATGLAELRVPPSNRLETLRGDRAGQHSIRVNQQWRICFRWEAGHAHDVEITDYH